MLRVIITIRFLKCKEVLDLLFKTKRHTIIVNITKVMINTREPFIEYVNFSVELIVNSLHTKVNVPLSISAVELSLFDILAQFEGTALSIFHMTKYVTEITGIPRSERLYSFFLKFFGLILSDFFQSNKYSALWGTH